MKKIFDIIFLFLISLSFAQTQDLTGNYTGDKLMQDLWFRSVFDMKIEDVQGSPYLTKDFVSSKIGNEEGVVLTRYDIYHDNIEFVKDGKIMVLPKDKIYNDIVNLMDNSKIVLLSDGKYYFKIFTGSQYQLLKKMSIKFQDFQKAKSGYDNDKPAKFVNLSDKYFLLNGETLSEISKNNKDFSNLFGDKSSFVLKYIKEQKLKLSEEGDLIKIMKFVESH